MHDFRKFGTATILALAASIGAATEAAAQTARQFPSGERITLSFQSESGTYGIGTITRRMKGQPVKSVKIDYMAEFAGIVAPDRVRYNVIGTNNEGQAMWSCEATIDWRAARIVKTRDLSPGNHPSCAP